MAHPQGPIAGTYMVAIAASAGGLKALSAVLASLPASFPAPIVIVQHLDPKHPSQLAEILTRRTAMRVKQAGQGDRPLPGTVYIAPPDHHLLVNADGTLSLSQSVPVHFLRPSADLLFESVASVYGDRAIALVLTGSGMDGAIGVEAIKRLGGAVIVQDAATSEYFGMPAAAIHTGKVDQVLPLSQIGPALAHLVVPGGAP